jgi:hypothetical protein
VEKLNLINIISSLYVTAAILPPPPPPTTTTCIDFLTRWSKKTKFHHNCQLFMKLRTVFEPGNAILFKIEN